MARKSKESCSGTEDAVVAGVLKSKCERIIAALKSAIQNKDDASAEHASEWKSAKDDGIHNGAMKLCLSLDRMEEQKRLAFLTAFDAYRHLLFDWDAQRVMPFLAEGDQAAAQRVAQDMSDDDDVGQTGFTAFEDEEPEEGPRDVVDAMAQRDAAGETDAEEDAPWNGAGEPVTGDVPEDAGAIYNAGQSAGLDGEPEEDNPHETSSAAHQLWAKGWARGSGRLREARAETAPRGDDEDSEPATDQDQSAGSAEETTPESGDGEGLGNDADGAAERAAVDEPVAAPVARTAVVNEAAPFHPNDIIPDLPSFMRRTPAGKPALSSAAE